MTLIDRFTTWANRNNPDKNPQAGKKEKAAKAAAEKTRVDDRRIDYRYAQDNPFFFIKGQSVWTGVVLPTTSDDFASYLEEEQQVALETQMWQKLSIHYRNTLTENEVHAHIITRFVPIDVSRWERTYFNNLWNPTDLFRTLITKKVSPHLAASTPERRQYLLLRIGDFKAPTLIDPISRIIGDASGVHEEVFNARDLAVFRERARQLHTLLGGMGATPMDRADLALLIRKPLLGHFGMADTRPMERTRPWRGGYFDELVNIVAKPLEDCVEIRNPHPEDGNGEVSYTTTVTLKHPDPTVPYKYTQAWGKLLRQMSRPVDVSWRMTIISSEEWKKRAGRIIRKIDDEVKDRDKVAAPRSELFEQKYALADQLRDELETDAATPIVVSQQRLCFSAPTRKELAEVVGELQSLFGEAIVVERPRGVQGFLLEEQLPGDMTPPKTVLGAGLGRRIVSKTTGGIAGGEEWTDLAALSFARLDSSPTVGDEVEFTAAGTPRGWRGGPIGFAESNGAVVHFDPCVQMARNSGAGTIICGSSGGGKSSLSLLLFFWASESGVQTLVIDPKNDFERFCYYLAFGNQVLDPDFPKEAQEGTLGQPDSKFQPTNPQFWEDTSIVSLGNGAAGMLDPWSLSDSYAEGEELARTICDLVFDDDDFRRLEPAFHSMRETYDRAGEGAPLPRLADLANHLDSEITRYTALVDSTTSARDNMAVTDRINALHQVEASLHRAGSRQFGRLMFGHNPSARSFTIGNKRRVVITLMGVTPPGDGVPVAEWDDSTRDAAAALMTTIHQISRVFNTATEEQSPNTGRKGLRPRLLFIDEAYFVTAFKAGRNMLNIFLRQGRSRYFGVVFISQQAKDVNKLSEEAGAMEEDASVNQFPTKFVFRQGGHSEARDAMKLLKSSLEKSDPEMLDQLSRELLKPGDGGHMKTGLCVMSDADNRVSRVQVDRMFKELVAATETNPVEKSNVQAETTSSNGEDWTVDTTVRDGLRTGLLNRETGEIREALSRIEYGEYSGVLNDLD